VGVARRYGHPRGVAAPFLRRLSAWFKTNRGGEANSSPYYFLIDDISQLGEK
jgi:hypothetical protein